LSLGFFSPSISAKGAGTNLSLGPFSSLGGAGTNLSVVPTFSSSFDPDEDL